MHACVIHTHAYGASARVHSRLERLEGTEQRERSAARQGGVYGIGLEV